MKKLTLKDIDDLLMDYREGIGVSDLSKIYKVSKCAIYYHIKIEASKEKIPHPIHYLDHIKNHIVALEGRIKNGSLSKEEIGFIESEIKRLRYWLKVDRSNLPAEPFVLQ